MRVVFYFTGAAGAVLALFLCVGNIVMRPEMGAWHAVIIGGSVAAGAAVVIAAAAKDYRGHWAFLIGIASLVVALCGLEIEVNRRLADPSRDLGLGLSLVALFAVCGILLLYSAHRLHLCLHEREVADRSGGGTGEPTVAPNVGPAASSDGSDAGKGPPSVS